MIDDDKQVRKLIMKRIELMIDYDLRLFAFEKLGMREIYDKRYLTKEQKELIK